MKKYAILAAISGVNGLKNRLVATPLVKCAKMPGKRELVWQEQRHFRL